MLQVEENVNLKPFNTFGIDAKAKYFRAIESEEQLQELMQMDLFKNERRIFLGGGSNVLFTKDFNGLIIRNAIQGIEKQDETDESILLRVSSGMNWHQFVLHCVQHNWGGIENLSLIPGTVGAAPIQNIGAYGVEVSEVIEKVDGFDITNSISKSFTKDECRFGYRESVFKSVFKEKNIYFKCYFKVVEKKSSHQCKLWRYQ